MSEICPWRCKGGHVMGMVVRNGSGIRQLVLYRKAIGKQALSDQGFASQEARNDTNATTEEEVEVMAIVEGYAADVRCSVCGRVRTWVPGEEAIRKLLESR